MKRPKPHKQTSVSAPAFAEGGSVRELSGGAKMYRSNHPDAVSSDGMLKRAKDAAKRNDDPDPKYGKIGREASSLAKASGSMAHDDWMKKEIDK